MKGRKPKVRQLVPSGESVLAPEWLNDEAKTEWTRVAPTLTKKGILTANDRAALASYCQAWARLAEAEALIERYGQLLSEPILNKHGEVVGRRAKKNPAVTSAKDYYALMLRAGALLGLSPADRQRIAPNAKPEKTLNDVLKDYGF